MDRRKDILTHHALVEHDGILVVVTLPWHERHLKVAAECELAVFRGITLCQNHSLLDALSLLADWTQVDCGALVGHAEFRNDIFFNRVLEIHEFLVLSTVIADSDNAGVNKLDDTCALCHNLCAGVVGKLLLNACADNRSLAAQQRHSLAHHVRSHQRTVGIIVLKERNQRCGD